jgi:hypothetical protein
MWPGDYFTGIFREHRGEGMPVSLFAEVNVFAHDVENRDFVMKCKIA